MSRLLRRGLFVPSRVIGIFTDTTISLSSRLRQRPDHYTIRAGRNLPEKEFRYLRTVIVTAAVYWGLNSELRCLTPPLNLPAPVSYTHLLSEFCLAPGGIQPRPGQIMYVEIKMGILHRPVLMLHRIFHIFPADYACLLYTSRCV